MNDIIKKKYLLKLIIEGSYINCSDKQPEEVKPKIKTSMKPQKKLWIQLTNTVNGIECFYHLF
jgi:hypothetical protein